MKHLIWLPVALLVGLIVGAWGPRSELRHAREEIGKLEALLKEGGGRQARLDGITRMLSIPESPDSAPATRTPDATCHPLVPTASGDERTPSKPAGDAPPQSPDETNASPAAGETAPDDDERNQPADLRARIDQAMDLWKLRSDIARSTFVSNAGLSDKESMQFDVLIAAMNMRIRDHIETWAEAMANDAAEMSEEAGVRLMGDLTGAMVLTYDEMDRTLPDRWRTSSGNDFSLTDLIDPSVAEPLIGVEGKLGRPRRGPFR